MKASDEPGPVRTLPPVLPETVSSVPGHRSGRPPDRRWVPIAVVGVGVAVLAAVGVFDAGDPGAGAGGPTEDTVPAMAAEPVPTTVPPDPALGQVIPGLDYNPVVVYRPDDDRTAWASWFQSSPVPTSSVTWGADSTVVGLDASGRLLMAVTDEGTQTLWLGRAPNVEPAFIDVRGAAWHPTEPGLIAFVGRTPGANRYHLYTGEVAPGGIAALDDLGPVSARAELLAWGSWGFALSQIVEPDLRLWSVEPSEDGGPDRQLLHVTLILAPDGSPARSVPGVPEAVGPNGELVVQPRTDAYRAAVAAGHSDAELGLRGAVFLAGSGTTGASVAAVLGPELTETNARFFLDEADFAGGDRQFFFTPDGEVVSMVNPLEVTVLDDVEQRIEVTTAHLHSNSTIRTVVDATRAIGFSRDGTYLIAQDDADGDLVLLDWNRGSTVRIPFALGRVLVFDI